MPISLDVGFYNVVCNVSYFNVTYNKNLTVEEPGSFSFGNDNNGHSNASADAKDVVKLTANTITTTYNINKYLVVNLKDSKNNPISGAEIVIDLNGAKRYFTDEKGQVKLTTGSLVPNKYNVKIDFAGNKSYAAYSISTNVIIKKATPKITAKAKTFKKSVKTKKYTITLKNNLNKVMKNTRVTIKVNKKTYSAKTNSKGVATFKITKLTKKGKFTATVKYVGSKYYNAKSVKVKITVK